MQTSVLQRVSLSFLALATVVSSFAFAIAPASAQEESEAVRSVHYRGQGIELANTDVPFEMVLRTDEGDFTIEVTEDTAFGYNRTNLTDPNEWIVGDWFNVQGTLNINTNIVTAQFLVNESLNPAQRRGENGWITAIDTAAETVDVQWNGDITTYDVSEAHLVVGKSNPADLSEFKIDDRVRLRVDNEQDGNVARIMTVLRRVEEDGRVHLYNLHRTRGFMATIDEIDGDSDTMNVTISVNPRLKTDDANNILGAEGGELTVNWDENTTFVRRYNGLASEDELSVGDNLWVHGRINDDGSITARRIKNVSLHGIGFVGHVGDIIAIDTETNEITVDPRNDNDNLWTATYEDDTEIWVNAELMSETDIEVGMRIRVRGIADNTEHTVEARKISAYDADHPIELVPARIVDFFLETDVASTEDGEMEVEE